MTVEVADSYSESNRSAYITISAGLGVQDGVGQCFTAIAGILDSCKFFLKRFGTLGDSAYAKIYNMTGTYGVNGRPTGDALATSDAFDPSTISNTVYQLKTFAFSGANRITLTAGSYYVIAILYAGGDSSNFIMVGTDTSSPTHSGNESYLSGTSWGANSSEDVCFYVYEDVVSSSISKVAGVPQASISKVAGVAEASISKVAGVSNTS